MLRRSLVGLVACTCACATAGGDRDEPTTPAAMVGLPSPLVTSTPSQPAPSDPSPTSAPIGTTTRVIADAPPPPPVHRGRRIDLDVKGADIHDVLRLLADVGRVNIVVGDDVQGSVTVRMRQVPWDQALDAIVSLRGLYAERDGNMIIVSSKPR